MPGTTYAATSVAVNDKGNKKKKESESFRSSFRSAKKAGKKKFTWNGKSYTTQTAEEKARTMTDKQVDSKASDTYHQASIGHIVKKGGKAAMKKHGLSNSKIKSQTEIASSYVNEKTHRLGDKVAKGQKPKGSSFATKRPKRLK